MELTSPGLVAVVAALAVAGLILAVLDQPRPRREWLTMLVRAGRVLLVSGLAVMLFALSLNNQYLFYTSWGDLIGSTRGSTISTIGSARTTANEHPAGDGLASVRPRRTLPPLPRPGSREQHYFVNSPELGTKAEILVELPAGYRPSSTKKYPVILGLHGYPSVPRSFVRTGIPGAIDEATIRHQLAESIVVIPQINAPRYLDTECVNGGKGEPQVDTWLSSAVPDWIVQHFQVRTDRESWAAMGYSFGGWCAVSIVMRHPDVFGAAISFEGYFRPDFGKHAAPAGVDVSPYDLVQEEKRHPVPVALWLQVSRQDGLAWPSTAQFLKVARAPTTVEALVIPHGGHRPNVWQPHIPAAITWLGTTLSGFHAPGGP